MFAHDMKKGRVINVTSTNISPEICQRFNDISFRLSGARNVSAGLRLNDSAVRLLQIQAKHTLIFPELSSYCAALPDTTGGLNTKRSHALIMPVQLLYYFII